MSDTRPWLSIVVPVLDEATRIRDHLNRLRPLRETGVEIVVVDGGSSDGTPDLASGLADQLIRAPRGRARQMNAGAAASRGESLLFLHADTILPADAASTIRSALADGAQWGRFDVAIDGSHPLLKGVGAMMNLRSRLTGIATGDQAIFVTRSAFERAGGYPDLPLMEDIRLSAALRRLGRPACLRNRVTTSGRRWESQGVISTILLMWALRAAFFCGVAPERLARAYGNQPDTNRHAG